MAYGYIDSVNINIYLIVSIYLLFLFFWCERRVIHIDQYLNESKIIALVLQLNFV